MSNLEVVWLQAFDTNKDNILSPQEVERVFSSGQWEIFKQILKWDISDPREKEKLDEAFFAIAQDFKRWILSSDTLDKNNTGTNYLIQTIGVIQGIYSKDDFDGKWWPKTQRIFEISFSPEERKKLKIVGEITAWPHKQRESTQASLVSSENKMLVFYTQNLTQLWVEREMITKIEENADRFKKIFPELDLYLSQGKKEEARKFLEQNISRVQESGDPEMHKICWVLIEALKGAEIMDNPEKITLLQAKQKVSLVLEMFEVINSDDSIFWLKNEKKLYYDFAKWINHILDRTNASQQHLTDEMERYILKFREQIYTFVYAQKPLPSWDPRSDIHYRDTVHQNDTHIKRISERFMKFGNVMERVIENKNLRSVESISTMSLNAFINTTTDNPLTNADLRFARKSMTAVLREKMKNNFKSFYEETFNQELNKKYTQAQLKQKVQDAIKEIQKKSPKLPPDELEMRAVYYVQKTLEDELEETIFSKLDSNKNITWTQRRELEKYIELFDPKNDFFNIWIDGKNNLLEEVVSLPLTAFVIWRVGKFFVWGRHLSFWKMLLVDALEWLWFELLTRARQTRWTFEHYTGKDLIIWVLVWAALFWVMKVEKISLGWWREIPIKFTSDTLKNRWANHLIEAGMFTWIEWVGMYAWYDENIFKWGSVEKILNNIGILYLVKLGYTPKEFGWMLPPKGEEIVDSSQAIRGKESPSKMKWVGSVSADGGVSLSIKQTLGGNIENVMNGFGATSREIHTEFQQLLQSSQDVAVLKIEASKLIQQKVDLRVAALKERWVQVTTQADLDFIATYKLQRIAEFHKLIEAKEHTWKIPKEMDMTLDWFPPWKLKLENPERMDKYMGELLDNIKNQEKNRDNIILN